MSIVKIRNRVRALFFISREFGWDVCRNRGVERIRAHPETATRGLRCNDRERASPAITSRGRRHAKMAMPFQDGHDKTAQRMISFGLNPLQKRTRDK